MLEIGSEEVIFSFAPGQETIRDVEPNQKIKVAVRDGFNGGIKSPEDSLDSLEWDKLAPATGPIGIKDAQPGDTLKVEIENIDLADQGAMITTPGAGAFGDMLEDSSTRIVPIEQEKAIFNENISVSIKPMIGVMGTVPPEKEIDTGTPGRHGGNMDIKEFNIGSTIYLPVFEEGGKLALGDMHAVMGDGEVSICGVEIGGEVTMKVEIIKNMQWQWPILETDSNWYVIASQKDLEKAIDTGLKSMYNFLEKQTSLEKSDIISLLSIAGDVEICQIVNPLKTVRIGISKESLTSFEITF